MRRKFFSILTALALCLSLCPFTASAEEPDGTADNPWPCGAEGANLTAWLSDDKTTLTISGTGAMADYGFSSKQSPWYDSRNNINQVSLPEGLTTIGEYAFYSTSLQAVDIPEGVTTIGQSAFQGSKLREVTIPDSVTEIGVNAFSMISLLTSVTIPAGVTKIGANAFKGCGNLETVTFERETPPEIVGGYGGYVGSFYTCENLTTIHVPHGCAEAYKTALTDTGVTDLNIVTAPEEHNWNDDGSCVCGAQAVAKIGDTYYTDLRDAFNNGGMVELLADVALPKGEYLVVDTDKMLTLNCGDFTLSGSYGYVIQVSGTLHFLGGTMKNTSNQGVVVLVSSGGTFTMSDGTLEAVDPYAAAVDTIGSSDNRANVNIRGGSVGEGGRGLNIGASTTVQLSGGTYGKIGAGNPSFAPDITVPGLLAKGYAFFRDGAPVPLTGDPHILEGPVTVAECTHEGAEATPNDDGTTHSIACPACGYTADAKACDYTYQSVDETNHKGVCVCGREKTEKHILAAKWSPVWNEREVTITYPCEKECGYAQICGKVTVSADHLEIPYGQTQTLSLTSTIPESTFTWTLSSDQGDADTPLSTESSYILPGDWNVGEYRVSWAVTWTDGGGQQTVNGVVLVTVTRAALTGKPTFGSGEGKTLGEVEVTLPDGWQGTLTWTAGADTQVVQGTSYAYTFTPSDTNYAEFSDTVILWAKPSGGGGGGGGGIVTPPVDPDPGPDEPDPPGPDEPDPPVDPDEPLVPDGAATKLEVTEGIAQVPPALAALEHLNTPEKLTLAMRAAVTQAGIPARNTAVYDVKLMVSTDGGLTWTPATQANFPSAGLVVTLPYPEGTDSTYQFTVVHMFTTAAFGKTPGDTETPTVTNAEDGLRFTVTGLSPISVGWKTKEPDRPVEPDKPVEPSRPSGGGGSGSNVSSYRVTVEPSAHGQVISNRAWASQGGAATLTVTPDAGYELDVLTVTDSRGDAVKLTNRDGGKYTFTMPDRAVTVTTVFKAVRAEWENPYSDVVTGAWYEEAVRFVTENGLMKGVGGGRFAPGDTLTRAQFAQILFNRAGRPVVNYLMRFEDVPAGAWYTEAVRWAASENIVSGVGGGRFAPDDPITREQLATILWRYAGSPAAGGTLSFTDAGQVSGYAMEALRWAVEQGIISGKGGGVLDPKGLATRAQAASMLRTFPDN